MADSAVQVTAGSGTNIDTRTESTNSNHRQVIVVGDPSTNAGVAPVDGTAGLKVDLGADNDVTVTGTVTANLGATDNAVLDSIAIAVNAEDAVHGSGDSGIMSLAVRNDTLAALAGTDGDYAPLQVNATGALYVASETDYTLDSGAADASTLRIAQATDDAVPAAIATKQAAAGATDTGFPALGVRNDDLADLAGADGDYAPFQVTQNGALLMCPAANDDYKYAAIDAATSGNNTLVAAAGAGVKIRVLACFMVAAGDVVARFEDGAGGTALTGQMDLTTNSGVVLPYNPGGWFETSANTLLNLELDGAVSVDGSLTYIEVA